MNEKFYDRSGRADCCGEEARETSGRQGRSRDSRHTSSRSELLRKIQQYNFMMIEAGLFLNNQPCCEAAQVSFCEYQRRYLEAVEEYEDCYGPLTYSGVNVKDDGWSWSSGPWPWEAEEC